MYNIFEDEDDIFMGSPKSKFLDIIFNANRGLVDEELERLIERIAILEIFLDEDDEVLERKIKQYAFENRDEVELKVKELYMESMGNIVTRNE